MVLSFYDKRESVTEVSSFKLGAKFFLWSYLDRNRDTNEYLPNLKKKLSIFTYLFWHSKFRELVIIDNT